MPEIREVSFIGWNFEIEDNDDVVISLFDDDRKLFRHYPIKSLYSDKRHAEKACVLAQEAKLVELTEGVREYREKIFGKATQ
jgi:hypothetical protein